ncbi:MAG: hypothetical protein NXH75_00685 [Halobacteriovoraceae bacterium]|nr:hypothetical protein [Halobacteriovoraceae bacterium]
MENNEAGGVFINGRAQVLEMLQYLTPEEKERLIRQIRPRNPQLADEMMESSITFKLLPQLPEQTIERIISYIKAPILGVALKSLNTNDQRKVLSVCERGYAEEAFKVMNTRLTNESRDVERACSRVKAVMSALSKKRMISL